VADALDSLRIASPCLASWEAMRGDQRVRLCALCNLNVYDLAHMTRADALALVRRTEGRACVRLWRRSDGTVITSDCPLGTAETLREGLRVLVGGLVALLLVVTAGAVLSSTTRWIVAAILSFGRTTGKIAG